MHKCGLCRRVVSVRPSVTFVDSVETNRHIFKIILPPGSHTILVFFSYQTLRQYPNGDPLTAASNAGGVGRNRDSQQVSGYLIEDWWSEVRTTSATVDRAVYDTNSHALRPVYSDATQLNSTSSWVELRRYRHPHRRSSTVADDRRCNWPS